MNDPSLYKYRKKQAGMAYVVLLALLAIMTTMGLSFLFKVGIETSATETRSDQARAGRCLEYGLGPLGLLQFGLDLRDAGQPSCSLNAFSSATTSSTGCSKSLRARK